MTACATETADRADLTGHDDLTAGHAGETPGAPGVRPPGHTGFTIAADGSYAARLSASPDGGWFPERWTLDGPEPYVVPLPGPRPETPANAVLPMTDGRVLIARRVAGHHLLALLYPSGPDTGEVFLGAVESERLMLLPPAPCGSRAYALAPEGGGTRVWLVADCAAGGVRPHPVPVAWVRGHCTGGAWLDREGRLLALDRTDPDAGGRTKTVAVDLARDGEVSPLLEITDDSDDRLLLADPDSGLLLVRSNAPGEERLGWGVLGSHRPIRFAEALHPEGARLTPFAVQPGQTLLPENCAVALCVRPHRVGAGSRPEERQGIARPWLAVWHPARRGLDRFPAPRGWLTGSGVWTSGGELRLPCSTPQAPCGLARLRLPAHRQTSMADPVDPTDPAAVAAATPVPFSAEQPAAQGPFSAPDRDGSGRAPSSASAAAAERRVPEAELEVDAADGGGPDGREAESAHPAGPDPAAPYGACKPVPLQQAPLSPGSPPRAYVRAFADRTV